MRSRAALLAVLAVAAAAPATGLTPAREVWLPAAARLGGWVTDLVVFNPGGETAAVELRWIQREVDSRGAPAVAFTLGPEGSLVLDDAVLAVFGLAEAAGAIRVSADREVVVTARIWNAGGGPGSRGQGFEGVPAGAAVAAGGLTHVVALRQDGGFRSNLFAVNPGAVRAVLRFELLDPSGTVLATSADLVLPPWSALYRPVTDLGGPDLAAGTVRARVLEGAAIVVGSRVDNLSLDPTTLEAWLAAEEAGQLAGAWHGTVADPGGFLGGMVLAVGADATASSVELTFPSALCGIDFVADAVFTPAAGLAELAAGVEFTESYDGGGSLRFTLRLSPLDGAFSGEVEAVGSGFGGSRAACNGVHPPGTVRLGRLPS